VSRTEHTERTAPLAAFLAAVQFLLLSPAFIRRPFTAGELGAAVGFYPLVGILLGGLLIGADWLLGWLFPSLLRAALLLAVWVLLTGALHLDGFLDACDGLLGGFTPERRLEIMRDERVGAYALSGGILLLLIQFSALDALDGARLAALLLAPALGRWGIALALIAYPYARPNGLGKEIKENARLPQLVLATGFALVAVLAAVWLTNGWATLAALVAALLAWTGATRFARKRIPGLTGDVYGATNLLVETAVMLAFVAGQALG
jgi:adenosylcobinamide-GDP ribazoletransferase